MSPLWKIVGDKDDADWSYKTCKATVRSPSINHSSQPFTGQKKSTDFLTPSSPGIFELCLWPLNAPDYLGEGLPSFPSAL